MMSLMKYVCVVLVFLLLSIEGFSSPYIGIDSVNMYKVREAIQNGKAPDAIRAAYEHLIENANRLLSQDNPSVINKTIEPPTENMHDYLSISRYWWPNPETPDGFPWVKKDGETNPASQTDAVDRKRLSRMTSGVETLCLAYYFTSDERYAEKAASMLKTWFLDDSTRMNPHLEFAQSVPGYSNNRPYGILDGRYIGIRIPDAMNILSTSSNWTNDNNQKLRAWLTEYLIWLIESELGKKAFELDNNHGTWYKAQIASLALFLGENAITEKMLESAQKSLAGQLNSEGGQIHELTRTRSFSYSCFNLDALTIIAVVGNRVGKDMWHYETEDGKSLSLAIDYLAPVVNGEAWPHPSISGVELPKLVPILARMSNNLESDKFADLLSKTITILIEEEKATGTNNKILQELRLVNNLTY